MNYAETIAYLNHALPEFQRTGTDAYRPGLERAEALDAACGFPHLRYRTIHVAGTNGKGSVSHMTAAVLQQAGFRTGLFTSPHIKDFRERIRVNGAPIPEEAVISFVEDHRQDFESIRPSFFEMTSALAFDWFARQQVDFAVIETGLGGRMDSTSIIRPELAVITNIGFDHMALLGDTLPKIAREKAGIICPATPVVIGESNPETDPVFAETARLADAPVCFADTRYTVTSHALTGHGRQTFNLRTASPAVPPLFDGPEGTLTVDLQGLYQTKNIVTFCAVWQALSENMPGRFTYATVRAALENASSVTGLCGRWQVLSQKPYTVCDIAHNAHGFAHITEQWRHTPFRKLHVVIGMVHDKDIGSVLKLLPADAAYYFAAAAIPRALPAAELQQRAASFGLKGCAWPSVTDAYRAARNAAQSDDMIYIGGSTFVVAEVL